LALELHVALAGPATLDLRASIPYIAQVAARYECDADVALESALRRASAAFTS
jgi:hypothetical protein